MAANVSPHSLSLRDFVLGGSPSSGAFVESFPRDFITSDSAIGTTTLITAVAVPLIAGDTVTKISFCVGATAGATLTHQFCVLYSGATVPLLLAQSTDAAAASMAANTVFTGTMATAFVVPSTGLYWAGLIVTGTTIPTLVGKITNVNATVAAALNTLTGNTNGVAVTATGSGTGTAPATMASITQIATMPYCLIQ